MPTKQLPLRVEVRGRPGNNNRVGFIALEGAHLIVRVRYTRNTRGDRWACDACGTTPNPSCGHAWAMAQRINQEQR